jgi:nucleotide-binding universal stress UspA family protein
MTSTSDSGPIVLASDGGAGSAGAIRFAKELAARWTVGVIVVAVPDLPFPQIGALEDRLRHRVSGEITAVTGSASSWPIEIAVGSVPEAIATIATRNGARIIVMGAPNHDVVGRLAGHRLAIETAGHVTVPVLVVLRAEYALPDSGLVVADDVASGIRAARMAVAVLVPRGTLTIAHVMKEGESVETVKALSAAIVQAIDVPAGITVDTVALTGDPARAIERANAERWEELVVVGLDRQAPEGDALASSLADKMRDYSLLIL